MKRVKLCDAAYIELTQEQFDSSTTIEMKSSTTNETLYQAKEIYLPRNMILLIPLSEFEEVEDPR